jgi:hypothetical protein
MRSISDHPDDFDREWVYRWGYAHGAQVVAALRPHLPQAIRRKAEMWLACELMSWRVQSQPKMTQRFLAPRSPRHHPDRSPPPARLSAAQRGLARSASQ